MSEKISPASARRIALAAQGFGRPKPASVGTRQFSQLFDRLGVLQIDSVNVFERSHYLPVFARLGAYDKSALDAITHARRGRTIEYWGHEATFMPRESWPLWRWKMERLRERSAADAASWSHANRSLLEWLIAELRDNGPLAASEVEHDAKKRKGNWWGWSDVKTGLEMLFRWGDVASAGRSSGFERRYGLPEQILPSELLATTIDTADAVRELVRRASIAHGIGTLDDFADYFRLPSAETRAAIRELVDAGELLPVTVLGWEQRGKPRDVWVHRDARRPRKLEATALLSPFDPVVWARDRAERLFGFHYRIEIYTPRQKRVHGYYVLPVLIDEHLAARIDLKSDRQAGVLRVQSAWREPGAPADTVPRLAQALRETAAWQGHSAITVGHRGTLVDELAIELASARHESP